MLVVGAEVYDHAGRYDNAIDQCRRVLELDPNVAVAHSYLARAYEGKCMYKECISEAEKRGRQSNSTYDSLMLEL
jgi:tetratricopeptide (TPR) repeat protein